MDTQKNIKKVRLVVYCSPKERSCIKMLAARRQMTIGEYVLYLSNEDWNNKFKDNELSK